VQDFRQLFEVERESQVGAREARNLQVVLSKKLHVNMVTLNMVFSIFETSPLAPAKMSRTQYTAFRSTSTGLMKRVTSSA
jgi:hypothetical protein